MGRSKRERYVALTKTRKKLVGREEKQKLLGKLREHVDAYESIYLFSVSNMRNALLKDLRERWKDSRFFMGRNRIAQIAFGRSAAEEYADGLSDVSASLKGNIGLLFTNRPQEEVQKFFIEYSVADYARSGFEATESVVLNAGELDMFVPSQEQNLRLLGLPVSLKHGKVMLAQEFVVCQKGDVLVPERAKILEYLGYKQAMFSLILESHYRKDSGFRSLITE